MQVVGSVGETIKYATQLVGLVQSRYHNQNVTCSHHDIAQILLI